MKIRDSRFELLRIVAMIMIIFTHYSAHGIMKVATPEAMILWGGVKYLIGV